MFVAIGEGLQQGTVGAGVGFVGKEFMTGFADKFAVACLKKTVRGLICPDDMQAFILDGDDIIDGIKGERPDFVRRVVLVFRLLVCHNPMFQMAEYFRQLLRGERPAKQLFCEKIYAIVT